MNNQNSTKRDLHFLKWEGDKVVNFWNAEPSGDWSVDNAQGREFGSSLVFYIQQTGDHSLFGSIIKAMGQQGNHGGIEVGFLTYVSFTIGQ